MPGSYVRIDDVTIMDPQTGLTYFMPVQASNEEAMTYGQNTTSNLPQNQRRADDNDTIPVPGFEIPGVKAAREAAQIQEARAKAEELQDPYAPPDPASLINPYPGKKPIKDQEAVNKSLGLKKGTRYKESVSGPRGGLPPEGNVNPYAVDLNVKDPVAAALAFKQGVAQDFDTVASARQRANEVAADIGMREAEDMKTLQGTVTAAKQEEGKELAKKRLLRSQMADDARNEAMERIQNWEAEFSEAANTEVDNNRYWNNRSGFQKVMFVLSAAAGSAVEHIYGKNSGMELLKEEIAKDIASQNDSIARKMDFMKMKRENIGELNMLDRIRLEDFDADTELFAKEYMLRLESINSAIEEKKLQYGKERIPVELVNLQAQIENEKLQVRDALGNTYLEDANQRRSMMFEAAEAAKQRSHQWGMAKQEHKWDMERQQAEHMAKAAEAGLGPAINAGDPVGIWSILPDGTRVPALVLESDKVEQMDKAQLIIQNANKTHTLLHLLKEVIQDEGTASKWLGDKDKQALLKRLILAKAKSSGLAPISESDLDMIGETMIGAASASGMSNFKPGSMIDVIDRNIDMNIRDVHDDLHTYAKVGTQVEYKPVLLYPKKEAPGDTSIDDRMAEIAGKTGVKSKARKAKTKQAVVEEQETHGIMADINQLVREGKEEELALYAEQLAEVLTASDKTSALYKAVNTGGAGGTDAENMAEYAYDQLEKLRYGQGAGLKTNIDKKRESGIQDLGVDAETAEKMRKYEQGSTGRKRDYF